MPIIRNFGFLWERKYINLGGGGAGNKGGLCGYRDGAKTENIDFRDQIGVYALYDETRTIVYVGQAGNGNATLFDRLKQHMKGSNLWNRWTYFSWVGFKDVNNTGELSAKQSVDALVGGFKYGNALDEIEGILIELIEPKLNKQDGRWKKAATEYFQVVPDEQSLEGLSEQIRQLEKSLKGSKSSVKR